MQTVSFDDRLSALARAAVIKAGVPERRVEAETDGLLQAMRGAVATSRAAGIPQGELADMCHNFAATHGRLLSLAYAEATA